MYEFWVARVATRATQKICVLPQVATRWQPKTKGTNKKWPKWQRENSFLCVKVSTSAQTSAVRQVVGRISVIGWWTTFLACSCHTWRVCCGFCRIGLHAPFACKPWHVTCKTCFADGNPKRQPNNVISSPSRHLGNQTNRWVLSQIATLRQP